MSKIYRAKIVYDIIPEESGLLAWQDEEDEPMTHERLLEYAVDEMFEIIMNGAKYNDIWNMIEVEVIDE